MTFTVAKYERARHISTHTLTWSVTFDNDNNASYLKISTHTLTWSVTRAYRKHLQTL